jgi:hypothetical protein
MKALARRAANAACRAFVVNYFPAALWLVLFFALWRRSHGG